MGALTAVELTVEQLLSDYSKKRKIKDTNKPILFSLYAVDNIILPCVRNSYDIHDIFVDGQNDTGIDGAAITLNDQLITTIEQARQIILSEQECRLKFIFIQATMEREFKQQKMTAFAYGVWSFFKNDDLGPKNARLLKVASLKDEVLQMIEEEGYARPEVELYYVSNGQWKNDQVLEGAIRGAKKLVNEHSKFRKVEFTPLDFRNVLDMRRTLIRRNKGEIHTYGLSEMPSMPGVRKAFLGTIMAEDLISIIQHPVLKRIDRNIFLENVRGFQGKDNFVNAGINETLNGEDSTIFPILNNGITIVCRDHEDIGPKLTMFDYQIVNGCQTSNILFANRDAIKGQDILIPAKIVVTRNEHIIGRIIQASNSQTTVTDEHILSLQPFNRRLAEYYRASTIGGNRERLYYDVRQGEFSSNQQLEATRIITIKEQIQNFASMFLGRPHDAINHLKSLRDCIPEEIFNSEHSLDPYYSASLAMYRFHALRTEKVIDTIFENYRFQILYILRKLLLPKQFNLNNWRSSPIVCSEMNSQLCDPQKSRALYIKACEIIQDTAKHVFQEEGLPRELAARQAFSEAVIKRLH